ncbi:lipopolysaccharide biosynthesis protein [Pseudonocardia adelaidensis]|uniref:O-antigen/teichoic acid export membrane protein n=1 Tax=Pseudonocardia adelaidensis TaxID=648754 RepID=A0ABP9NM85_9PSEU
MIPARRLGTAAHLAAGLGVLGAAGYAFVAVIGHVFHGPADAGALTALISLYMLVNIIGPGVFAALEQETSRSVSAAAARGEPLRPVARRAGVLALWSFAALVAVVLVAWPLVLGRVLEWRPGLLAALLVAIAGSGAVYWARGLLGGQQRFTAYARTLYVEGAVRLLPCLALLAAALEEPSAYGLAFAIGSAVAALSVWPALNLPPAGVGPTPDGMGRSLLYLAGAIALSQLLANLAPVVVTYRSPEDLVAAAVFGSTFVLARVPLFLFAPVQAVLLPQVTRAATMGRRDELTRRLWQVLGLVTGLGALGVAGCVWLGPWAAERLFNTAYRPSVGTLALLGTATLVMMLALVVQPTLIALARQRTVTIGWIAGSIVFLVVLVVGPEPIAAALVAQLVGPLVVLVVLLVGVLRALHAPSAGVGAPPATGRR